VINLQTGRIVEILDTLGLRMMKLKKPEGIAIIGIVGI
jgi:hypothetical protein